MSHDRYARQRRIDGWDQAALSRARVLVAGAGALGNELIKNLTLLGVGQLLIIDFDRIELSNLSRTVLFGEADVGRPKAQAAAQAAARFNPQVELRYIDGDLFFDVGLGFYRHCTLVVGGLDSLAARSQVGLGCRLAGVPFLDGGMWAMGGEIRWFVGGDGPCFECTLSDDDRRDAFERRSCTGFQPDAGLEPQTPTTISTAAIIGGLLAQEAARYLCRWPVAAGEAIVYNGLTLAMHRTTLSRNPACPHPSPYQQVIELPDRADRLTARALLQYVAARWGGEPLLALGRDFLLSFFCRQCGTTQAVERPLSRVAEAEAACPTCGRRRQAEIISQLDRRHPQAGRTLGQLGVPAGELLAARAGEQGRQLALVELTGDIDAFWA